MFILFKKIYFESLKCSTTFISCPKSLRRNERIRKKNRRGREGDGVNELYLEIAVLCLVFPFDREELVAEVICLYGIVFSKLK